MSRVLASIRDKLVTRLERTGAALTAVFDSPRLRRPLVLAVVALSFLFMAYVLYINWKDLEQYRRHMQLHYPFIALAFLLYPLGLVPNAVGWHSIMKRLGGLLTFRTNARIYCLSCLPRRIPGGIWHAASRAVMNKEQGIPHSLTLLGTLLEWILLIISGLLVYLLSRFLSSVGATTTSGLSPGLALVLLVPLLALLYPPLFNRMFGFLLSKSGYQGNLLMAPRDFIALLTTYALAWMMGGVVLYVLTWALFPLPVLMLPAVIGAWAGAGAIGFVTAYFLQGLGIREVTLAVLLSSFMPLPIAIVVSILFRLLLTTGEVLWPLLWARYLA